MHSLYITSENGSLYKWEGNDLVTCFKHNDYLMGLARLEDKIYVGSRNQLFSLYENDFTIHKEIEFKKTKDFHHIEVIDKDIYVAATSCNEIGIFSSELQLKEWKLIVPPNKNKAAQKPNYNHINKIIRHDCKFYVNLNWFEYQYGPSGVAVLDSNFVELERYAIGWQTHGFRFIDGKRYVLCASTPGKELKHPHKAGLFVENELVFTHDPNLFFCKDFIVTESYVFIVGGTVGERTNRKNSDGVIFVLDRNFRLISGHILSESGGFKGCMI